MEYIDILRTDTEVTDGFRYRYSANRPRYPGPPAGVLEYRAHLAETEVEWDVDQYTLELNLVQNQQRGCIFKSILFGLVERSRDVLLMEASGNARHLLLDGRCSLLLERDVKMAQLAQNRDKNDVRVAALGLGAQAEQASPNDILPSAQLRHGVHDRRSPRVPGAGLRGVAL